MATYKTNNLPGFEHLLVIGTPWELDDGHGRFTLIEAKTLINSGVVVGDRELKINLPNQSIFINIHNLELVSEDESARQFASDNPFGELQNEGRLKSGNLEITYTVFENAVTVTIIEKNPPDMKGLDKTLYSHSFFGETRDLALDCLYAFSKGSIDPDDLIFELSDIYGG